MPYWYYDWPWECYSLWSWAYHTWGPNSRGYGWRFLGIVHDYQPKTTDSGA